MNHTFAPISRPPGTYRTQVEVARLDYVVVQAM